MFIKLTKLDGLPIWINSTFVVTVEPRKGGGSVVVPVGDGLDYDVRESPEKVLALLGDAPAPAVVPIPTSDALTKTPEDVSAESDQQLVAEARQCSAAPGTTGTTGTTGTAGTTGTTGTTGTDETAGTAETEELAEKSAKKPRKAATAKKPRAPRKAKKPALPISEEQVERLKKMAPGSVKKLQNTLQSQFKVEDAEGAVKALEANGVLALDRDHVVWG